MKMNRLKSDASLRREAAPSLVSAAPTVLQPQASDELVTAFGEQVARSLSSSVWQERASALERIRNQILQRAAAQPGFLWQPTCNVLQTSIACVAPLTTGKHCIL